MPSPLMMSVVSFWMYRFEAVKPSGVNKRDGLRAKNLWTLGLIAWMYGRDIGSTVDWLKRKFAKDPQVAEANIANDPEARKRVEEALGSVEAAAAMYPEAYQNTGSRSFFGSILDRIRGRIPW